MRIKILIIFFIAFIFSFLIYNFYNDERINVLSIGDDLALGKNPFNSYGEGYNDFLKEYLNKYDLVSEYNDYFVSEGETFESIIHKFDDDYYIKLKNKKISLRKSLAKSDVIIFSLSNEKFLNKKFFNKDNILKFFDDYFLNFNFLVSKINKISNADIILLIGYSIDFDNDIYKHIVNLSSNVKNNVYIVNLYKDIHDSYIYLPNDKVPFPSLEGYDYIFKNIVFSYDFGMKK